MHTIRSTPANSFSFRSLILLFATTIALLISLLYASTTFSKTSTAGVITVCKTEPLICDFSSIQAAIDASAPGEEIRIGVGVYTETLILPHSLTIRGTDSAPPTITAVTAAPIISASGIQSITLRQLNLDGRGVLAAGLVMTDVNLSLDHIAIRNLRGADGHERAVNGEDAVALTLSGAGALSADVLRIGQLTGGSGYITYTGDYEEDYRGGSAIGIVITGTYSIGIRDATIDNLLGGDAGTSTGDPYSCTGSGGRSIGILADGSAVRLNRLKVGQLQGGRPCSADVEYCDYRAGAYFGVAVRGGSLTMSDSNLTDFSAYSAHSSLINTGVLVQEADQALLNHVHIEPVTGSITANTQASEKSASPNSADSPFCVPAPFSAHAVRIEGVDQVTMDNLEIRNVTGENYGGEAVAIAIADAANVSLTENAIEHVNGGYASLTTMGISLLEVDQLYINGNDIRSIVAGSAPSAHYYLYSGAEGGSAIGIRMQDIAMGQISGNIIRGIRAGAGTGANFSSDGKDGGDAAGIVLEESRLMLAHNSIVYTHAGEGGSPAGQTGQAYGIRSTNSNLYLAATALAQHITALAHMTGTIYAADNSFWLNETDMEGVQPSPTDLYEDPGFVDLDAGDLHLRADSPLIDRAGWYGSASLLSDMDGQPRPLDGNGDGLYRADIGADEFFAAQDILYLRVTPMYAAAGESVAVTAIIENPDPAAVQTGVTFESLTPDGMEILTDSLQASMGEITLTMTDGRQGVAWTGQIPTQDAVAIRYRLRVKAGSSELRQATVTASTTGAAPEMARQAEVKILLAPYRLHLPFIATQPELEK